MEDTALSPFSSAESLSTSDLEDEEVSFFGFPKYPSYSEARTKSSYGAMAVPPRSPRFFADPLADDQPHHFLDSCALCGKPLGGGRDIFMYRGDTPFCSEECRKEQIEMDEAKEKRYKMAMVKPNDKESKSNSSTNPSISEKIEVRGASTLVAG